MGITPGLSHYPSPMTPDTATHQHMVLGNTGNPFQDSLCHTHEGYVTCKPVPGVHAPTLEGPVFTHKLSIASCHFNGILTLDRHPGGQSRKLVLECSPTGHVEAPLLALYHHLASGTPLEAKLSQSFSCRVVFCSRS